jgi:putative secretion ATPase (PEP-CTERM system associated)
MYAEHYGFTGRPFQLTPDPRFYFDSATHRKAMAYLGYGLAQGEGFIVITGDIGTGKTTLVGHLMATIDASRLTALHIVSTQVEGDDMLRLTAQGLGLVTEGLAKAQLLDRIEAFLHSQSREGKRTLLIVDEAQNLPISALEELRMLSNFQYGGQALVQIFLLGQPEFREALDSPRLEQLRQRVIATHHLTPMGEDEIADYIGHRLAKVGWEGNPRFTAEAYAALHRFSGGIPRKINMLASRVLLYGALEQLSLIDETAVDAVLADMAIDGAKPEPVPAPVERPRVTLAFANPPVEEAPMQAPPRIDPTLAPRIAALEARVEEQEKALRRVLTLLVDWIESDEARPQGIVSRHSAA